MSLRREINNKIEYKNKSKNFLLPMLEVKLSDKYLLDVGFIQGGFPQIVIIFENVDHETLKMDIYKLQNMYLYVDACYDDDDKEVCLFFDVPKEYLDDFDLFVQGKYSKFSEKFKQLLIRKFGNKRATGINPKNGLPTISMQSALYPVDSERRALANSLGVKLEYITEVLDPPNFKYEEYKSIEELKKLYERREDISSVEEV